jgi:hypothetical protein
VSRYRDQSLKKRSDWQEWRKSNLELIKTSGIPIEITGDIVSWNDFLEFSVSQYTDFNINELSVLQKIALLRLIETRPIDLRTHVARLLIDNLLSTLEKLMRVNPTNLVSERERIFF